MYPGVLLEMEMPFHSPMKDLKKEKLQDKNIFQSFDNIQTCYNHLEDKITGHSVRHIQ